MLPTPSPYSRSVLSRSPRGRIAHAPLLWCGHRPVGAYPDLVTTFVLVHGAWHGAWCWDRLVPLLAKRGHDAITMDLPVDDASATFDTYADVVDDACRWVDDVVLVGHSLGGMALPLVSARRSVRMQVFLCAVIPNLHGRPWDDAPPMGSPDYGAERDDDGALVFRSPDAATAIFYADCTPEDAAWAYRRLRPLRNRSLWDRAYPLARWPAVPSAAITCTDDLAIYADYQRAALRDRLRIRPVELPGHHSPFLARPAALADALVGFVGG